jgi:hypothetical protein
MVGREGIWMMVRAFHRSVHVAVCASVKYLTTIGELNMNLLALYSNLMLCMT